MKEAITHAEAEARRTGEFQRVTGQLTVDGYRADGYAFYDAPAEGGVIRRYETLAGKGEWDSTRYAFIDAETLAAQAVLRSAPEWVPGTDYDAYKVQVRAEVPGYEEALRIARGMDW